MKWKTKFNEHGDSFEDAFEGMCVQLFLNWSKSEGGKDVICYSINGSGGDGGIEAYAEFDGRKIGIQAKGFIDALSSSQFAQIRSSIKTAFEVRPELTEYIICLPRDLASKKNGIKESERDKYDALIANAAKDHPGAIFTLWDNTLIKGLLQKEENRGIYLYYFSDCGLYKGLFRERFEKVKECEIKERYIKEITFENDISRRVRARLGNVRSREAYLLRCKQILDETKRFLALYRLYCPTLSKEGALEEPGLSILERYAERAQKLIDWMGICQDFLKGVVSVLPENSDFLFFETNEFKSFAKYGSAFSYIQQLSRRWNAIAAMKPLSLIETLKAENKKDVEFFLASPGTGKTCGIAYAIDSLLEEGVHVPIYVSTPCDTITGSAAAALGLRMDAWNENEFWQALEAHAATQDYISKDIQAKLAAKVVVFFDGVDEALDRERWQKLINEARYISGKYSRLRFVFAGRPNGFPQTVQKYDSVLDLHCGANIESIANAYFQKYRITVEDPHSFLPKFRDLLSLRLFCENHKGSFISRSQIIDADFTSLIQIMVQLAENDFSRHFQSQTNDCSIAKILIAIAENLLKNGQIQRESLIALLQHATGKNDDANRIPEFLVEHRFLVRHERVSLKYGIEVRDIYYSAPYRSIVETIIAEKIYEELDASMPDISLLEPGILYPLSSLMMRERGDLPNVLNGFEKLDSSVQKELILYALRFSNRESRARHQELVFQIMRENHQSLLEVLNKIMVFHIDDPEDPLGVKLLERFHLAFSFPVERDLIWSSPEGVWFGKEGDTWFCSGSSFYREGFRLSPSSPYYGRPIVWGWRLSCLSLEQRAQARKELARYARSAPYEFLKLLQYFDSCNDPQVRDELFLILNDLALSNDDKAFIKEASTWVKEAVLVPKNASRNRSAIIRRASISMLRKAVRIGLDSDESIAPFLPPFHSPFEAPFDVDGFNAKTHDGYKHLSYDLSRYVLNDSIYRHYRFVNSDPFRDFAKRLGDMYGCPEIKPYALVNAFTYGLALSCGYPDYDYRKGLPKPPAVAFESALHSICYPASHGAKSEVMSIVEKYAWCARYRIKGYLCDHLPGYPNGQDGRLYRGDYIEVEDMDSPMFESVIDELNERWDCDWSVPEDFEEDDFSLPANLEELNETIRSSPSPNWGKLIIHPDENKYALKMSRYHEGTKFIESLFEASCVLVPQEFWDPFVVRLRSKSVGQDIIDPSSINGGYESEVYYSPIDALYNRSLPRLESPLSYDFMDLGVADAVDSYAYAPLCGGEVLCDMPSRPLCDLCGIVATDGLRFFDRSGNIASIVERDGESWGNSDSRLLISSHLIDALNKQGYQVAWIAKEYRSANAAGNDTFCAAEERAIRKFRYYLCFCRDGKLEQMMLKAFED